MQVKKSEKNIRINEYAKEEIEKSSEYIIGAIYNNEYVNLDKSITEDGEVELLGISSKYGMKMYRRTLVYILDFAISRILKDKKLLVNYQLPNEMYCEIRDLKIDENILLKIEDEMKNIIDSKLPIEEIIMTRKEAKKMYTQTHTGKGRLQIDLDDNEEIYMYKCSNNYNYFYEIISNTTNIPKVFMLEKYSEGFVIKFPNRKNINEIIEEDPSVKLEWGLEEYQDIYKILDMDRVYKINKLIENEEIAEAILLAEALHEKKIANIADKIKNKGNVKIILVAGPSSSGKTTFAKRLGIQLKLNGIKTVTLSVDNYFVERKDTPLDENGKYNFEDINAIDLELFNNHLSKLINKERVELPEFDFVEGKKQYKGKYLQLKDDEILVVEGIHCLNDKLTNAISKNNKYKVYISALTTLHMDRCNRISTTDTRLIRRMVRDFQFRGYSANETIHNWESVNKGEIKYIFPFQEQADSIFNTSLVYELFALKVLAMPLLEKISKDEPEYKDAKRLINMLKYFKEIPSQLVPRNSLLKEFLGGGILED